MQNLANYNQDYYHRPIAEHWFKTKGLLRPDQLAAVCYTYGLPFWGKDEHLPRTPGLIVSIGCGSGELEKWLIDQGEQVLGVDPSPGAQQLYSGELIDSYQGGGQTIIFCESLEHLPAEEINRIWGLIPPGARVIIVNWPDYHPIHAQKDGWDHITTINDDLYDQLSSGFRVILRRQSHLVMEKNS